MCAGCSEELGPEKMPTAEVNGKVLFEGKPVSGGWLEFHPVDGTVGKIRSAPIARDGSFHCDAAAVGRCTIQFVQPPRTIPGGTYAIRPGMDAMILDMNIELLKLQNQQKKQRSAKPKWQPSARRTIANSPRE